jgi:8-oxo-dGTP pyrophosphatase MutT (NUDIX family)
MSQKYVVYLNGKPLFFNNAAQKSGITYHGTGVHALEKALETIHHTESVSLPDFDPEEGISMLKAYFPLITAAGGVVKSPQDKLLLIQRLGYWDLPKGKIEAGESNQEGAAREIEEETGVIPGKPLKLICRTWHTYNMKAKTVLKETYWFYFEAATQTDPVVQTEEQISAAAWVTREEAQVLFPAMYPSVCDVLENFFGN